MFDWNEELGDITWGEESDDHIVPYPKGNEEKSLVTLGNHRKKQCVQEANTVKFAAENMSEAQNYFYDSKLESGSQFNTDEGLPASGIELDSWPDSPLTGAACDGAYAGKNGRSSMDMQVSDFETEMPKLDSSRDDEPGLFGNACDDKKNGAFLDYSWDNIGTFDDLDKIFRNDVPIFGRDSLGNADLWSSSTDVFSSPTKPFPICSPNSGLNASSISEHREVNMEFVKHEEQSLTPGYGRVDDLGSHTIKNVDSSKDKASEKDFCHFVDRVVDCVGGKSNTLVEEKIDTKIIDTTEALRPHSTSKVQGKRKLLKRPKEESEGKLSQDLRGPCFLTASQFQQFGNQFATSAALTIPSSVSLQKQTGGREPVLQWETTHPYLSAGDVNSPHHYPVMPTLPIVHTESDKHQSVFADYGFSPRSLKHANPLKMFEVPVRLPTMTPREKLEKLRRRQQMQAMLAIQEQQQQLGHETPLTDLCSEKYPQENQHHDNEGSSIEVEENMQIPPSVDPNSPTEHDDSNTIALMIDDCSLEERVLDQLQDVIGKLDIKIRHCIRDSLFRLAQSAMQRQSTNDTSSTNNNMDYNGVIAKVEAHGRNRLLTRIPEETETNPIDRTVAHLLFHQPLESSMKPVKDDEIPGSPASTRFLFEPKTEGIKNLSREYLSDYSKDKQSLSQPPSFGADTKDVDQIQSNVYIHTPENTGNCEPEDFILKTPMKNEVLSIM